MFHHGVKESDQDAFQCFQILKLMSISLSMAVVAIALMSARLPDEVKQVNFVVPSTGSLMPSATFNVGLTSLLTIILFLFTMPFLMRDVVQQVSGVPCTLATLFQF